MSKHQLFIKTTDTNETKFWRFSIPCQSLPFYAPLKTALFSFQNIAISCILHPSNESLIIHNP